MIKEKKNIINWQWVIYIRMNFCTFHLLLSQEAMIAYWTKLYLSITTIDQDSIASWTKLYLSITTIDQEPICHKELII